MANLISTIHVSVICSAAEVVRKYEAVMVIMLDERTDCVCRGELMVPFVSCRKLGCQLATKDVVQLLAHKYFLLSGRHSNLRPPPHSSGWDTKDA